jgi:membrane protease YdiL (CAAX protease family)
LKKSIILLAAFCNIANLIAQEVPAEIADVGEEILITPALSPIPTSLDQVQMQPPILPQKHKSIFGAVALSYIFPGLGHMYLEEYKTASNFLLWSGTELGLSLNPKLDRELGGLPNTSFSHTLFYGIYATYRDARIYNHNNGYAYKMPTDSFSDLIYAPFNYKIMRKPEVWGALLIDLVAAFTTIYLSEKIDQSSVIHSMQGPLSPFRAFPVGIGEESFFRGYLMPICSEFTNSTGGLILSSTLFGAAHIPNASHYYQKSDRWKYYTFSLPLITSAGMYFGYLTQKNNSLQEAVAVHAWYDFILFSLSYLATEENVSHPSQFAITIPF